MMENLKKALDTIENLADAWPSNADLLADGGGTQGVKVARTRDNSALPFHLARITDTEHRTRTRDGAIHVLEGIWDAWGKPEIPRHAPLDTYKAYCYVLRTNLPRLAELCDTTTIEHTTQVLERLARDATRQTATGLDPAGIPCPECRTTQLGRPYTSQGLLEILVCERCERHYSLSELNTLSKAHARYGDGNMHMTLADASLALDVPLKTLAARVVRNNVEPVGWHGKRRTYRLRDIR